MNKEQRTKIENIKERLQQLAQEVEALADEEQEKYDNLNEGMQAMERFKKNYKKMPILYIRHKKVLRRLLTLLRS